MPVQTDPWGTPLSTGTQGDNELLIVTLHAAIQSLLYPLSGLSIQTTPPEFRNKGAVQDCVKCFEQVQVDGVSHSSFIHQYCNPVVECHQVCQA